MATRGCCHHHAIGSGDEKIEHVFSNFATCVSFTPRYQDFELKFLSEEYTQNILDKRRQNMAAGTYFGTTKSESVFSSPSSTDFKLTVSLRGIRKFFLQKCFLLFAQP